MSSSDPTIRQWLADQFGEEGSLIQSGAGGQLTALILASRRPNPPEFPDEVLTAWRQMLVHQRLTMNQSEDAFIDRAIAQGYTWEHIAEVFGHTDAAAAQDHHEQLKAEIERAQPTNNPRPYLR